VELLDAEGNRFEHKKSFALCRCGLSQRKPFCDGSHKGNFDDCTRAKET
jgi:CDGSH-type Zn-finger protein